MVDLDTEDMSKPAELTVMAPDWTGGAVLAIARQTDTNNIVQLATFNKTRFLVTKLTVGNTAKEQKDEENNREREAGVNKQEEGDAGDHGEGSRGGEVGDDVIDRAGNGEGRENEKSDQESAEPIEERSGEEKSGDLETAKTDGRGENIGSEPSTAAPEVEKEKSDKENVESLKKSGDLKTTREEGASELADELDVENLSDIFTVVGDGDDKSESVAKNGDVLKANVEICEGEVIIENANKKDVEGQAADGRQADSEVSNGEEAVSDPAPADEEVAAEGEARATEVGGEQEVSSLLVKGVLFRSMAEVQAFVEKYEKVSKSVYVRKCSRKPQKGKTGQVRLMLIVLML
jgi:hypothetical protein